MKNVSLILSIVAILVAAATGIILLTSDKDSATASTSESTSETAAAAKGDIVYIQLLKYRIYRRKWTGGAKNWRPM